MDNQNVQIGDMVLYNSHKYKVKYIYDDGSLKLIRSNEVIFRVPIKFIQKLIRDQQKTAPNFNPSSMGKQTTLLKTNFDFWCKNLQSCNKGEILMTCKYNHNEFCVNDQCPMCADYCPVPDIEGVCQYEEREDKIYKFTPKGCLRSVLIMHDVHIDEDRFDSIWEAFNEVMTAFGYVEEEP